MNRFFLIATLLPLLGLLPLFIHMRQMRPAQTEEANIPATTGAEPKRAFSQWLGTLPVYRDRGNSWREARQRSRRIAGISLTLQRCGIGNPRDQLAICMSIAISALLLGVLGGVLAFLLKKPVGDIVGTALAVCVVLIFCALVFVRQYAARRQLAIEQETPTVIQMTRMLWRAGLSLPRTFAVLCDELRQLAPEITRELRSALQKINSGQSQEEALAELAELTTAEGFREYLVITRQVSQSGGAVDQALADLYGLLQNQRRTGLQEKVSKLSAKMSVVMMLFLFPSLLIVLGGPGLISINGAFAQMGSK